MLSTRLPDLVSSAPFGYGTPAATNGLTQPSVTDFALDNTTHNRLSLSNNVGLNYTLINGYVRYSVAFFMYFFSNILLAS